MRYILPIFILLITISEIRAQVQIETYFDIGSNNVSEGLFIKNIYRGNYQHQKYKIESGLQFDWLSNNPNTLTGFDIIGSRKFSLNNFPFDVKGFFMLSRFSDIAHETNCGAKLEIKKLDHFILAVGTNFKTYKINSKAREDYDISQSNSTLSENFNLIYLVSAYIKPHSHIWNIGVSVTNIDYYIISQSTNPVFNLEIKYKVKPQLNLFLESWYKQAGMLNINANYFGYFFRGGVKWEI